MSQLPSIISDGSVLLAMLVALLAGLLSFFSPCVLPLIPGYLTYLTGMSGAELMQPTGRRPVGRLMLGAFLFVLGFSAVFVSYGVLFGGLGFFLQDYGLWIQRAVGVIIIVMGLAFMGVLPGFRSEIRVRWLPRAGLAAGPVLGVLFGLGWTPCLGPTIATVLGLATQGSTAGRGALLAFVFCLGLGIPFLLAALGFTTAMRVFGWMKRHSRTITIVGGVMLVAVGLLLVTGWWNDVTIWLQGYIGNFEVAV